MASSNNNTTTKRTWPQQAPLLRITFDYGSTNHEDTVRSGAQFSSRPLKKTVAPSADQQPLKKATLAPIFSRKKENKPNNKAHTNKPITFNHDDDDEKQDDKHTMRPDKKQAVVASAGAARPAVGVATTTTKSERRAGPIHTSKKARKLCHPCAATFAAPSTGNHPKHVKQVKTVHVPFRHSSKLKEKHPADVVDIDSESGNAGNRKIPTESGPPRSACVSGKAGRLPVQAQSGAAAAKATNGAGLVRGNQKTGTTDISFKSTSNATCSRNQDNFVDLSNDDFDAGIEVIKVVDSDEEVEIIVDSDSDDEVEILQPGALNRQAERSTLWAAPDAERSTLRPASDELYAEGFARVGKSSRALNSSMTQPSERYGPPPGLNGPTATFKSACRPTHYKQAEQQHRSRIKEKKARKEEQKKGASFPATTEPAPRRSKQQSDKGKQNEANQCLHVNEKSRQNTLQTTTKATQAIATREPSRLCHSSKKQKRRGTKQKRRAIERLLALHSSRIKAAKKALRADTSACEYDSENDIVLARLADKEWTDDDRDDHRKPAARKSSFESDSKSNSSDQSDSDESSSSEESDDSSHTGKEKKGRHHPRAERMPAGEGTQEGVPEARKEGGTRYRRASFGFLDALANLPRRREEWATRKETMFAKENTNNAYTLAEFQRMWAMMEGSLGKTTKQIEQSGDVRKGNKNKDKQYGRILFPGMDTIFRKCLHLNKESCFLDIGHGLGNTCMQAAYTFGCRNRGIEVDEGRNDLAKIFEEKLKELVSIHENRDGLKFKPGQVDLRVGQLQDKDFRSFQVLDVDRVFVNNFGGVFSGESGGLDLDRHLGGLFALMKPKAVMATLSPLRSALGCRSLDQTHERRHHLGLADPSSPNTSYYQYQVFDIGAQKDTVSWSEGGGCEKPVLVHVYTRTEQSWRDNGQAFFMCNNPSCTFAKQGIPTPAVEFTKEGAPYIASCKNCRANDRMPRR